MNSSPLSDGRFLWICNEVNGRGAFQFAYAIDEDRYFWHYLTGQPLMSGGDAHRCHIQGKSVSFRFVGSAVSVYGLKGPNEGIAAYAVDGAPSTRVDGYAAKAHRGLLFSQSGLKSGAHTLVITVSGEKNTCAQDCFVTLDGAEVFQPAVNGAFEVLEDINATGNERVRVHYHKDWLYQSAVPFYLMGDCWQALSDGAQAEICFEGAQLELYGSKGPEHGLLALTLDGASIPAADLYACGPCHQALLYRTPRLAAGTHRLTLTLRARPQTGHAYATLDFLGLLSANPHCPVIKADPQTLYQTISGFGASSGWTIDPLCSSWKEENRRKLADCLYSEDAGIGLTHFRFDLGAGSRLSDRERINGENHWRATDVFQAGPEEPFNPSAQSGQQWMMRAAQRLNVPFYTAYVHSPPFWMTKNGHTQCEPDCGSTNLKDGMEETFAAYLVNTLKHLEQDGLFFDFISPINEPGWRWDYPQVHEEGCRMGVPEMQAVIGAVSNALAKSGLKARMLAPEMETVGALARLLPSLREDRVTRALLEREVSAHSYFTDLFDTVGISARMALKEALKANGNPDYWQTEFCLMGRGRGEGRDYGITPALWLAQTVHYDLTILNAVSWQWWLSVSTGDFIWKDGLIYTDWKQPGDEENVIASKMLWALGHYSRFIRPGARRIRLSGLESCPWLLASAYKSAQEEKYTLVVLNLNAHEQPVQISGSSPLGACAYLTDEMHDMARIDSLLAADGLLRLPPRSIATLVCPLSGEPTRLSCQQS